MSTAEPLNSIFRSADGRPDRLPALLLNLFASGVDVIVASLTPAAIAARQATAEIRSSWQGWAIRWQPVWWRAWRDRAATSSGLPG